MFGQAVRWLLPGGGVDLRIAALVGMAGACLPVRRGRGSLRSSLASRRRSSRWACLPLLGGCTTAYFVSCYLMPQSIMTEKIARRGVRTPHEYVADVLEQVLVREVASSKLVTITGITTLRAARSWIDQNTPDTLHQGFPIVDGDGCLLGIVTRKDLAKVAQDDARTIVELLGRPPIVIFDDCTVREAVDHMLNHDVGRLPVVRRGGPAVLVGIITRGDVLGVYRKQLADGVRDRPNLRFWPKSDRLKKRRDVAQLRRIIEYHAHGDITFL